MNPPPGKQPIELGKAPDDPPGTRDAVHVPVVVGVAGEKQLCPGDPILLQGERWIPGGTSSVAVVDPFGDVVSIGGRFFACFPPGKVRDVRHVWTHPALDGASVQSVEWMENWVRKNIDLHPDDLEAGQTPYGWWMDVLRGVSRGQVKHVSLWGDDYDLLQGLNNGSEWPKICYHYAQITGRTLDPEEGPFFSCFC